MAANRWIVWTYALLPGWEMGCGYSTREEARDIREELIEVDAYPPEFVSIRRESQGAPRRRPPLEVIEKVRRQLAREAAEEIGRGN